MPFHRRIKKPPNAIRTQRGCRMLPSNCGILSTPFATRRFARIAKKSTGMTVTGLIAHG